FKPTTWVTQFSFRSGLLLLRLWTLWATRSVVHKSTAFSFGFSQPIAAMSDGAEHERSIANGPTVLVFAESDGFADQSCTDVDHIAVQLDLAIMADATYFQVAVFRLTQNAIEAAG